MTKSISTTPKPRGNPFKWLFKKNPQFVLAFFIPFGILLLAYLCFGVYPVGNRSVLSLDLNGQYVYYFDYMYDVFAGRESLFYSWSRSLSGEFMGIIGYYLASPFNFLVWLFPRAHITEGLLVMLVTKAGAIGVCMSVYLSRGRGLSKSSTVIFSMLYALCSYTIVQTMNPMWLDGVMALPLIVYGIESLIRHGRFRMLIISLIYSFVTCFYIGYMLGIFAAVYFLFYFFASETFGKLNVSAVLARIGLFFISAVTALMCSAFMLLPVYSSLSLGKFEFSTPDYSIRSNFNFTELFGKLLPGSYDTVRMEGLPFLYCGILTVIMLVCFFVGGSVKTFSGKRLKPISTRKRIACAVLLLFLTVCMYITPVDMLWHGGQLPNWLPYRYSFILSFLMVGWAAEAFERLRDYPKKLIGGAALGFFAIMVFLENTDTFKPDLGKEGRDVLDGISVILPAMLILIIITAMLLQWRNKLGKKRAVTITFGILIGCELFYNTIMGIVKQDIDIVYSSRDSYVSVILPAREAVQEIYGKELAADPNAVFRIEKNFFRTVNDPLALNMYGLSHSSSTLNERPIELLGRLGLTSRSHYTRYSGATPIIDDLFGVKYILSANGNDTANIKSKDDITVEENADALPIAYLVDAGFADFYLDAYASDKLNVFQLQNRIVSEMLGEPYTNYFTTFGEDKIELETENVKYGTASGGHTSYKVETSGKNAQIKYRLTAERDGEIFLWMPTDYERKLNVWVNKTAAAADVSEQAEVDLWKGNLFETDNYCVKSLGEFFEGEEFSVTLTLTKDDLYFKDIFFAYLNKELYSEAVETLHSMNVSTHVEKLSPTHLKIGVVSDEERLLFTTIPVEPGWSVSVDGIETKYLELLPEQAEGSGSLIGVIIPPGSHIIEMKFNVNYYPEALYITGGGILLLILMFILGYRLNKAKRSVNPENDGYGDDDDSLFDYNDELKKIDLSYNPAEKFRYTDEIEPEFNKDGEEITEEDISEEEVVPQEVISDGEFTNDSEEDSYGEDIFNEEVSAEDVLSEEAPEEETSIKEKAAIEEFPLDEFSVEGILAEKHPVKESGLADDDFLSYNISSVNITSSDSENDEEYSELLLTEDFQINESENQDTELNEDEIESEAEYDKEEVEKNINHILGELVEINRPDSQEEAESSEPEDIEAVYGGSADDLFPDDEIENMEAE